MAERIGKANFDEKIAGEKLSLVDFYSDSCMPCKILNPVLGDIEDEFPNLVNVYKVNTNFDAEIGEKQNVLSTPTLILFRNGKEIGRKTGVQSKQVLVDWIQNS